MKRKYQEQCYFCGQQATSDEHAPPKKMFKGFDCDSITVPSCGIHNSSKGGNDRAIINALILPLYNTKDKSSFEEDIKIAINNNTTSFEKTKYKAIESPLIKDITGDYGDLPELAYLVPSVNMLLWIKELTAAVVWDGIKKYDQTINWNNVGAWSPDWIVSDGPTTLELDQAIAIMKELKQMEKHTDVLPWIEGWSAYPKPFPRDVYQFHLHFRENNEIVFKHRFFNRYSWYVWFIASSDTYIALSDKIRA